MHSGAFRKLQYKTQVFVYHEGDYYRTRLTHSLEVAQIARSIARRLALDEDLAEALALAHDLGHTPFGHAGEEILNRCLLDAAPDSGGFRHNDQTLRILTSLERRYADFDGLNLTWETLEGVVKHDGPFGPDSPDTPWPPCIAAFQRQWDLELGTFPGLEAQVAALSDDIAYNNHDLDDGLRAGLFSFDDLRDLPIVGAIIRAVEDRYPKLSGRRRAHETIRRMIASMIDDLVAETGRRLAVLAPQSVNDIRSASMPMVAFSADLASGGAVLRAFLFERMYRHYRVNRETSKARRVIRDLFDLFIQEPYCLPTEWRELAQAGDRAGRARIVTDYIAGMTDRYAVVEHQRLFDLRGRF